MAQLVERTLGKGEVPSSILGISTILFGHREVVFLFLATVRWLFVCVELTFSTDFFCSGIIVHQVSVCIEPGQ